MKILQVHNIYQGKTGEEAVVDEERKVLEENGHKVIQYIKDNASLKDDSKLKRLRMICSLNASKEVAKELGELLDRERPDICHVHNTFPIITPIVYEVCKSKGVPVIQTLHNYKMICTNSLLFRNGEVCELCLNRSLYNSIKHKCYRDSYFATAAQAHVIQTHRKRGTWENSIDRYICLTDFQKDKLIAGGMNPEKMMVKHNFLSEADTNVQSGSFFLFVGRLNDSKGLQDLLYLFAHNNASKFVLIGKSDNPEVFNEFDNVEHLGEQDRSIVLEYMRKCKVVLFPSMYYEGMPMVILEAFSHKKPVIARNTGAMSSMIKHEFNGFKYEDRASFVSYVELIDSNESLVQRLGDNAFNDYKAKYSREIGYKNLIDTYTTVLNE
ncbi:MAG: glycosyltransferase family 4 protein [Oceanospirillaceae bacterium]|nr:glycosyltransferase family 4 protein [Oceanospirillaceae bacterium]